MTKEKPWYKSKTKAGAALIGVGAVLGTVGSWMTGSIDTVTALTALMTEVGVVLGVFGVRDWPVINKKK